MLVRQPLPTPEIYGSHPVIGSYHLLLSVKICQNLKKYVLSTKEHKL